MMTLEGVSNAIGCKVSLLQSWIDEGLVPLSSPDAGVLTNKQSVHLALAALLHKRPLIGVDIALALASKVVNSDMFMPVGNCVYVGKHDLIAVDHPNGTINISESLGLLALPVGVEYRSVIDGSLYLRKVADSMLLQVRDRPKRFKGEPFGQITLENLIMRAEVGGLTNIFKELVKEKYRRAKG